jgi:hypothetical protein
MAPVAAPGECGDGALTSGAPPATATETTRAVISTCVTTRPSLPSFA